MCLFVVFGLVWSGCGCGLEFVTVLCVFIVCCVVVFGFVVVCVFVLLRLLLCCYGLAW